MIDGSKRTTKTGIFLERSRTYQVRGRDLGEEEIEGDSLSCSLQLRARERPSEKKVPNWKEKKRRVHVGKNTAERRLHLSWTRAPSGEREEDAIKGTRRSIKKGGDSK